MASALTFLLAAAPASAQCTGDCNADHQVKVNELLLGVNIVLDLQPVSACEAFKNPQGKVDVAQLVSGVNNLLHGCPGMRFTPTPTTEVVNTPSPTPSPTQSCPLAAGAYTLKQISGGQLTTYTFAPFPFPAGGTIVEDVRAASGPDCVHDVVIPFPGGFFAPNFCVPALGFTVNVNQTGCGVGKLDSNGGSDFDTNEVADTSDSLGGPPVCNLPNVPCSNGRDASIRVDVTVGNGTPDTCTSGTANTLVTVPVHTMSWTDTSGGTFGACQGGSNDGLGCRGGPDHTGDCPGGACRNTCPGNGVFDANDTVVAEFDQILDFTSATAAGKWMDLDGDGCFLAGTGTAAGFTRAGDCMDLTKLNTSDVVVNTVAVGQFGATGGLFDGSFATTLPNKMSGPAALMGATCSTAPPINFNGKTTRCIP